MHIRAIENTSINTPRGPLYMEGSVVTEEGTVKFGDVAQVADDYVVNPRVFEVVEWVPDARTGSGYYRAKEFPAHGVRYMKFKDEVPKTMDIETFVAGMASPPPEPTEGVPAPAAAEAPKRRGRPRKQPQPAAAPEVLP